MSMEIGSNNPLLEKPNGLSFLVLYTDSIQGEFSL
jgi:hypothetical protein